MTPQEMISVIQAHADGKQIQMCRKGEDRWLDCVPPSPLFDFMNTNYRVKPPALRPHWPALVRSPIMSHSVTGVLFASDDEARDVIGFVRLATEYPPVMLP